MNEYWNIYPIEYVTTTQTRERTREMGLTRNYTMANYLMRDKRAFDTVSRTIRSHVGKEQFARMLENCCPDTLLKHPETLVDRMKWYLGDDATWKVLLGILGLHMPEFTVADLYEHDLNKLEKYDRCTNGEITNVIRNALSGLSEAELERVKLLLSWVVVAEYGHIILERTKMSNPSRLTEQIFSEYSDHAAYMTILIFTQIQRPDLVRKLTDTARLCYPRHTQGYEGRCQTPTRRVGRGIEAMPLLVARRGNAPR